MVQRGRRAVYEPAAVAFERPTPTNETEYRRKVRMFEHCWVITLRGSMLRRLPPGYLAEVVSHRLLRYGSGVLHLVLLGTSIVLAVEGWPYQTVLAGQVALLVARRRRPADRALLHPRLLGDRAGARQLPSPRSAVDLGRAGGHAMNRAARLGHRRDGLLVTSPLLGLAALAIKLEDGGPVLYRQQRVGKDGDEFELLKLRTMVVGAEKLGAGLRRRRGRSPHHTRRAAAPADVDRRAAAAVERGSRRDVRDRAATDAALPGRALRERQRRRLDGPARPHRLGADPRPRDALLGRADRARRLVRRARVAGRRPEDPAAHAARALRRHVQGRVGRLAGLPGPAVR